MSDPSAPATGQNPADARTYRLEVAALPRRKTTQIALRPNAKDCAALEKELGVSQLRKVSLTGTVEPAGKGDWLLKAQLGATAVQPCTITLEPVTTRIDTPVERRFVQDMPDLDPGLEEDEFGGTAMPTDDTLEPLGREISLWHLLIEALALALPDYPRAQNVELGSLQVTEPGKTAMSDEAAKPFAGLAALKSKLEDGSN